ncbi:biotin transporter BioY [Aneurinibacillus thermoaerophilus]|uniref:biotin transporter BioY n=1 Tax=Aneurinibacillus thermoaerophilus TaxID=143495 RepID=UPI002E1F0493|nr:biotin transporter BioY [Aneurinibacillus thermoaerophilus]MED0738459.1 biotin transporter BioY [Aneurinibacillus thermoaerophilus]MED0765728.1 biotin transporter BioY [Aneurinibacillus thermoaerophilus]
MKQKTGLPTTGLILAAMFAALTAIGAFIKIPVPVVPFTLQILFVYFAGSLLGSRLGLISQLVYLAVGLAGAPVFTEGGGLGYVLKPTFGYLVGFAIAAYTIGHFVEKKTNPNLRDFILAHFVGLFIVYMMGTAYLYIAMNIIAGKTFTLWQTFLYGFLLAVPGDLLLCIIASIIAVKVYKQIAPLKGRFTWTVKA